MGKYSKPQKKHRSKDGRPQFRTDSRQAGNTTQFSTKGDGTAIGNGQTTFFDFSNSDNITTLEDFKDIPANYKRKRLVLSFADPIQIKEGAIYFHNSVKGQYIDMYVVCPNGEYYLNRGGVPTQATGPVAVEHYVVEQFMQGSAPMGDELNTEGANEDSIPTNYEVWLEVTTLDTDAQSNGWATLEIYRPRTVLLPGEAL